MEDKQVLRRFAEARRALRLACSSIDTVCDDGTSVWPAHKLVASVLEATEALNAILDLAEHVGDRP